MISALTAVLVVGGLFGAATARAQAAPEEQTHAPKGPGHATDLVDMQKQADGLYDKKDWALAKVAYELIAADPNASPARKTMAEARLKRVSQEMAPRPAEPSVWTKGTRDMVAGLQSLAVLAAKTVVAIAILLPIILLVRWLGSRLRRRNQRATIEIADQRADVATALPEAALRTELLGALETVLHRGRARASGVMRQGDVLLPTLPSGIREDLVSLIGTVEDKEAVAVGPFKISLKTILMGILGVLPSPRYRWTGALTSAGAGLRLVLACDDRAGGTSGPLFSRCVTVDSADAAARSRLFEAAAYEIICSRSAQVGTQVAEALRAFDDATTLLGDLDDAPVDEQRLSKARTLLQTAVTLDHRFQRAWLRLAVVLRRLGEHSRSRAILDEQASRAVSSEERWRVQYQTVLLDAQSSHISRVERALNETQRLLAATAPRSKRFVYLHGLRVALTSRALLDETLQRQLEASDRREAFAKAANESAAVLEQQPFRDEDPAIRLSRGVTHFWRGQLLFDAGHRDGAEQELSRAVVMVPDLVLAYAALARVHRKLGRERWERQALPLLDDALTRSPESLVVHEEYGRALVALERYPEAVAHLRIAAAKQRFGAMLELGDALLKVSEVVEAGRWIAQAFRSWRGALPDHPVKELARAVADLPGEHPRELVDSMATIVDVFYKRHPEWSNGLPESDATIIDKDAKNDFAALKALIGSQRKAA